MKLIINKNMDTEIQYECKNFTERLNPTTYSLTIELKGSINQYEDIFDINIDTIDIIDTVDNVEYTVFSSSRYHEIESCSYRYQENNEGSNGVVAEFLANRKNK